MVLGTMHHGKQINDDIHDIPISCGILCCEILQPFPRLLPQSQTSQASQASPEISGGDLMNQFLGEGESFPGLRNAIL